jgi:class 3 adenylate cyclase
MRSRVRAHALPQVALPAVTTEGAYGLARDVSVRTTERKLATVLFTDVKGSMDLISSLDLDDWWSTMAALFELMCEGVYRSGGWVGAFTGDGAYAVFESAGRVAEHAERACAAALWIRDAIKAEAVRLRRQRGLDVAVRIGINSGEVVSGIIGNRYSRYYTATGYPVAVAKRMEGIAAPGQIYLTEHTARLLGPRLKLRDLGLLEVKGAHSPIAAFELVGRK